MKCENIIYSIRTIIKSKGLDSRIDDRALIDMINRYRVFNIKRYYDINKFIKPEWFSQFGILTTSIVNSADDPSIQYTSTVFGKYVFPKIFRIPSERTVIIRSASVQQRIEEVDQHIVYKMIETEDDLLKSYITLHWVGDSAYFYPHTSKIWANIIVEDPFETYTYNELKDYNNNVISAQGTKRNLTIKDEYPICGELAVMVILDILTKEFNLERSSIPDIKVDSADTDDLMKSNI